MALSQRLPYALLVGEGVECHGQAHARDPLTVDIQPQVDGRQRMLAGEGVT